LNGGARKAGWQTRVRHGNNDESLELFGRTKEQELTSLTKVSFNVDDGRSLRVGLFVIVGGRGSNSWDKFEVEWPVSVVGAVDASSEELEMLNSSKLTPTMAGRILLLDERLAGK
jgi:hypothetical protein